jgi:CubicO group peptidase (beta-lactamase class C family)
VRTRWRAPLHRAAALRFALGLSAALAIAATPAWSCDGPSRMADGWDIAPLADAGLDEAPLCKLAASMAGDNKDNLHAVLVARNDALVFEAYGKGPDRRDGKDVGVVGHGPGDQHDLDAVTGSVTALLVGAALDRRLIRSVDDPVLTYLAALHDLGTPEREAIRLSHLLTMTAGFAAEATPGGAAAAKDPYRAALQRQLAAAPGTAWRDDPDSVRLLGQVIETATTEKLPDFARDALFEPLGITQFEWTKMADTDADPADGLRLRPRDMLKLGQLVLNGGRWYGRQIVPEAYLQAMARGAVDAGEGRRFGYLWWAGSSRLGERDIAWIAAKGQGGQRLYLVPSFGLAVAITAGRYDDPKAAALVQTIFERVVLAAFKP